MEVEVEVMKRQRQPVGTGEGPTILSMMTRVAQAEGAQQHGKHGGSTRRHEMRARPVIMRKLSFYS